MNLKQAIEKVEERRDYIRGERINNPKKHTKQKAGHDIGLSEALAIMRDIEQLDYSKVEGAWVDVRKDKTKPLSCGNCVVTYTVFNTRYCEKARENNSVVEHFAIEKTRSNWCPARTLSEIVEEVNHE